jgi:hypothetical protein
MKISKNPSYDMKLLSTATLAATLLSYVAADVSKVVLQQRALKAKSHTFSRELEVSEECVANQGELELTGINDYNMELSEEQMVGMCSKEKLIDELMWTTCDYSKSGLKFDSGACANAGGSIIKVNMVKKCDISSNKMLNFPVCLHATCDGDSYVEVFEDFLDMEDMVDDKMGDCSINFFSIAVSGAAIGSTSIISIALVSLFAMLWQF